MYTCKKYVLTGGPGVGKTAVINHLQQLGYATIPESYTVLFNEAPDKKSFDRNVADKIALQSLLIERQLNLERLAEKNSCVFLDRSLVDIIAYADYWHIPVEEKFRILVKKKPYTKIFFLSPLPDTLYKNTSVRKENVQESHTISILLQDAYKKIGYTCINVPFDTVKNRTAFILENI